jgi:murein DD-endopeptidase MepM/ murein hydrolase activator NlpD
MSASSDDDAYMNYYIASTNISDFDVSSDLDTIKAELTELSASIEEEQDTYTELQTDVEAQTDYIQCYPDFLPVEGTLTDGFGYRTTPRVGYHNGIDIAAARGTEIQAAGKGTVIYAGWYGNYGNCVIIDHGYGYKTLYGHMSKILVEVDDEVSKGDVIGLGALQVSARAIIYISELCSRIICGSA